MKKRRQSALEGYPTKITVSGDKDEVQCRHTPCKERVHGVDEKTCINYRPAGERHESGVARFFCVNYATRYINKRGGRCFVMRGPVIEVLKKDMSTCYGWAKNQQQAMRRLAAMDEAVQSGKEFTRLIWSRVT